MLKKDHRLSVRRNLKFNHVFKTPLFVISYQENGLSHSRFGFIVGKLTDKKAVVRNKIKRVFRSCIEDSIVSIKPGMDLLFIIKSSAKGLSKAQIQSHLYKTMKDKGLLHE